MRIAGSNITRGVEVPALDREKKWEFVAVAKPGDRVEGGTCWAPSRRPPPSSTRSWCPPR